MRKSLISILLLCFIAASCSGNDHKQPASSNAAAPSQTQQAMPQQPTATIFQSLAPVEAKQLIDSRQDLMIVDVRSPQELKEGAIANSALIPFWQILRGQQTLPRDKPLLLVCAVGGRSYAVGQILHRQGYPELYSLTGGIAAWEKAGLPLKY